MINKTNLITGAMVMALAGATLAATPASAWTRYHNNNDAGAIAGAAIGGMALGAGIGAATSHNRYYDDGYYAPPPPPPGSGYGGPGYGYDYGY